MKKILCLFIATLFILFVGCSSVSVSTNTETKTKIVKLATVAAVLFAANNKDKVSAALPYVKDALALAKEGTVTLDNLHALMGTVKDLSGNADVTAALALLSVEFSGVSVTAGTVNDDIVSALEAIVAGLEAGAAE